MCSKDSELAIRVDKIKKVYPLFKQPIDRLKQFFWPSFLNSKRQFYKPFVALDETSFDLEHGSILGVIGRNGSGKSTLLQMICGTLHPTSGDLKVDGRIAALLELGAGFNPEFTGRENIFLNASILGLSKEEIDGRYDEIVEFSGISHFIDQPVKTYSSGMYVRLAFSVAVCIDPDILIIDEALSVGDGDFSRKSFDRIMQLKEQGKTILFCSHSLYQIEMLSDKVLWLDNGEVKGYGASDQIVPAYRAFLEQLSHPVQADESMTADKKEPVAVHSNKITEIVVRVDGKTADELIVKSQISTLTIDIKLHVDANLPPPVMIVVIVDANRKIMASNLSHKDGITIKPDKEGKGQISIDYPKIALLKGKYAIDIAFVCDKAIYVYEQVLDAKQFEVTQDCIEHGVVSLEHQWKLG